MMVDGGSQILEIATRTTALAGGSVGPAGYSIHLGQALAAPPVEKTLDSSRTLRWTCLFGGDLIEVN
jgi:hypothetical protein